MKRGTLTSSTKAFEDALNAKPGASRYCLRLFITGTTPKCARAIENIRAVCEANLPGQYDLEVIDLYQHPEQAKQEQIIVTPTLVKSLPLPSRRMVGDLSGQARLMSGLDIVRRPLPVDAREKDDAA